MDGGSLVASVPGRLRMRDAGKRVAMRTVPLERGRYSQPDIETFTSAA